MNLEMQIIREVSNEAEDFYQDAVDLGHHAAEALKARHRSQMTGLENIAESSFKTSDVFDYIKKQTARFPHWRQAPSGQAAQGFGPRLQAYLENDLAQSRDNVCSHLSGVNATSISDTSYEGKQTRRRIYLLLIRQFIRSMVVEYEYQVSQDANGQPRRER